MAGSAGEKYTLWQCSSHCRLLFEYPAVLILYIPLPSLFSFAIPLIGQAREQHPEWCAEAKGQLAEISVQEFRAFAKEFAGQLFLSRL
jgi:hypothetical protein